MIGPRTRNRGRSSSAVVALATLVFASLAAVESFAAQGPLGPLPAPGARAAPASDAAPERPADPASLRALVEQLGDSDFFVRDRAQRELETHGFAAVDALTEGQFHEDLEIARRSGYLLKRLWAIEAPRRISRDDDPPEVKKILAGANPWEGYTQLDETRRKDRLEQLRKLPDAMGSEPLCRVVRYEVSPVVAKRAALTILRDWPASLGAGNARVPAMRATLGSPDRPAIAWATAALAANDDLAAARATFATLSDAERRSLAAGDERSEPALLRDLLAFRVTLARAANDPPETYALLQEMVDLEPNSTVTLTALVEELVAKEDMPTLEKVLVRFSERFAGNADLLYVLASVKRKGGDDAAARDLAERAFTLDPTDAAAHFRRAVELGRRGLWEWSEREAEFVRKGPVNTFSLVVNGDSPKAVELLHNYLTQDETVRMTRVREIAELSEREMKERERVAVLCRLARFERSDKLAAYAAAVLLNTPFIDELNAAFRARVIGESIGLTDRPAGRWLRLYAESLASATPAAAAEFGKIAAEETARIDAARLSGESTLWEDEIVQGLLVQQFSLLDRVGRRDDALAVLDQWLRREAGRIETLQPFVDLLVRLEAWAMLDRVAQQCQPTFQAHPVLLYSHARARQGLDDADGARQTAGRARSMRPNEKSDHWRTAIELYLRGLRTYAEGEYQYLIELGPPRDDYTVMAKFRLADLLSDRERFADAAELLSQALAAVQEDSNLRRYIADDPTWLPARIHWLRSENFRVAGDFAAQAASLWEAAKLSPFDADVLISLKRHPSLSDEDRAKTQKLIDEAAAHFQSLIQTEPDDASNYNQFAWLAANTGGDAEAAVTASLKSLELRPGTSGYLDTLGRCYFAKRDYSNAVKYQAMAVKLDPHSPSLNRQLAEFRRALDASLAPPAPR